MTSFWKSLSLAFCWIFSRFDIISLSLGSFCLSPVASRACRGRKMGNYQDRFHRFISSNMISFKDPLLRSCEMSNMFRRTTLRQSTPPQSFVDTRRQQNDVEVAFFPFGQESKQETLTFAVPFSKINAAPFAQTTEMNELTLRKFPMETWSMESDSSEQNTSKSMSSTLAKLVAWLGPWLEGQQ